MTPAAGEAFLSGFGRERRPTGTLDPLRAQAIAFRDSRGKVAVLVAADVLGFGRVSVDAMRSRIGVALGLERSAIAFCASHTHWGPAVNYEINLALGGLNVWYLQRLEDCLVKIVGQAVKDLQPATVSFGACRLRIGVNRRLRTPTGEVLMAPNPEGSYDDHTPILRITRSVSPQQLLLVGHACHPTSTGDVAKWSADYPGAMRRALESELLDCRVAFIQGCGGDAKVVAADPLGEKVAFAASPQQSAAAGGKLAAAVRKAHTAQDFSPLAPQLATTLVRGALTLQQPIPREEIERRALQGNPRDHLTWWARQMLSYPNDRRQETYDVQLWTLGELSLFALEGEVVSEWGPRIRAMAKTPHAMTIGYANHVGGYIPTQQIIAEGGYEGDRSHMAYFLPAPFAAEMEAELTALVDRAVVRAAAAEREAASPSASAR